MSLRYVLPLRWTKSAEGYTSTKDRRFRISPKFVETTRVQGYRLDDDLRWGWYFGGSQRILKKKAQDIVSREAWESE